MSFAIGRSYELPECICHQVLNGDVNFNLEQALKISEFLDHSTDEKQYFLWMVEFKRAGTQDLKNIFATL